jgi:hypothetical protein
MDVLMQLPVPLLHIMRDIRIEQLEEQKRQMDQSVNTPANAGVVPQNQQPVMPMISPDSLQELTDELS